MLTEKVHRQQSTPSERKTKLDFVLVTGEHFVEQLAAVGVELLDERLLVPSRPPLKFVGVREHKLENASLHRRLSMNVEQLKTLVNRLHTERLMYFVYAKKLKFCRFKKKKSSSIRVQAPALCTLYAHKHMRTKFIVW